MSSPFHTVVLARHPDADKLRGRLPFALLMLVVGLLAIGSNLPPAPGSWFAWLGLCVGASTVGWFTYLLQNALRRLRQAPNLLLILQRHALLWNERSVPLASIETATHGGEGLHLSIQLAAGERLTIPDTYQVDEDALRALVHDLNHRLDALRVASDRDAARAQVRQLVDRR